MGTINTFPITTTAHTETFGTGAGDFCEGNDARLSNARTPTAHKTSHASGGADAMTPGDIGAEPAFTKNTGFNKAFGNSTGTVAEGNHGHISFSGNGTTGFVPNPGGETGAFLRDDGTWVIPVGAGDMQAATYDPQSISADAFSRANHTGSQAIATITALQSTLDNKTDIGHNHAPSDVGLGNVTNEAQLTARAKLLEVGEDTFTLGLAHLGYTLFFTHDVGCTVTIPISLGAGFQCVMVHRGGGPGTIIVNSSGSETLDGANSVSSFGQYAAMSFLNLDGTAWQVDGSA